MRQAIYRLIALILVLSATHCHADNRIVLHFRHAAEKLQNHVLNEYRTQHGTPELENLGATTPAHVNEVLTRGAFRDILKPNLSGFLGLYGGYSDISNPDGFLSFPLRHTSQKIYVAITPEVFPVYVKGNTVSHLEYRPSEENPLVIYQYEKKTDEEKQLYWEIKKVEKPQDNKVNPITLVILSDPKNLIVPETDVLAAKSPQLVLPDIFVVGSENKEEVLLKSLKIKHHFEAIEFERKVTSETTATTLIKNR